MASLVRTYARISARKIISSRFPAGCRTQLFSTESDSYENPPIPVYKWKHNESLKDRKARLMYQSRKRGMLENGLLLSTFASEYLNELDERQIKLYDELINLPSNDWDIYYWMTGVKSAPPEFDHDVMNMLIEHAKNENREERFSQPGLYDQNSKITH